LAMMLRWISEVPPSMVDASRSSGSDPRDT
jgi:hypothetical protein